MTAAIFSCFFFSPGHWHAVKNVQRALLFKEPGWTLLGKLRRRLDHIKLSFTQDTFERESTFDVEQAYLGIMRAGWLRRRKQFRARAAAQSNNLDLQALVTFHDALIPTTLDFLKIIKHGQPAGYLFALPRFMKVMAIVHCTKYFRAFLYFLGDLKHVEKNLPRFYALIIGNLHRSVVELPIELQHKVIASHSQNISRKGYEGVDGVICEWPLWSKAFAFVKTYGHVFRRANYAGAYRLVDAEDDERNAYAISEYESILLSLFATIEKQKRATYLHNPAAKGSTIVSPYLGQYDAAYLGGDHWLENFGLNIIEDN